MQPVPRGGHPHMDNFLECVRSRQEPNLPARLGYQAMAAIGMGVQAYRQSEVLFFDRRQREGHQPAGRRPRELVKSQVRIRQLANVRSVRTASPWDLGFGDLGI